MNTLLLKELEQAAGKNYVFTSSIDRELYSYDATKERRVPEAVVRAVDAGQIARVLALCSRHGIPVTPRGAGTGLSGGSLPMCGGVVLDCSGMNKILELSPQHMVAVVQPGVVNGALQQEAARYGLFFPPDPASLDMSTLGGNVAENAGGPRAVKYGVMRDYVLGLKVVLADGRIMDTGGRTIKNVAGYDLTRLFVGSEGTLGVIVEATLRLFPIPEHKAAINGFFSSARAAALAVQRILTSGIRPAALEFLDNSTLKAVSRMGLHVPQGAQAFLLVDVDGPEEVTIRHLERIRSLMMDHEDRALQTHASASPEEYEEVWKIRRSVGPAVHSLGSGCIAEDIVVPLGSIAAMVERTAEIASTSGLYICCYGHSGDGNLHVNIVYDKERQDQAKHAWDTAAMIFDAAIALQGSISGEHGIGMIKLGFLARGIDPVALDVMQRIRRLLDPAGILNPCKALPEPEAGMIPGDAP